MLHIVCLCNQGAVCWSDWHRKDPHHIRQAAEFYA